MKLLNQIWLDEAGQDVAEYAIIMGVLLVLVLSTVRLIASNSGVVYSSVASGIQ